MSKKIKSAGIIGTGSYLPEQVVTNQDLEKTMDTSDEWIRTRTGISERRKANDDMATSDMAAIAAERAVEDAGLTVDDIDLIIVGTVTPDMLFPSTACLVQEKIKARNAAAFDLSAACAGFLYGLSIANNFIAAGTYRNILVIGAETLSRVLNPDDRNTAVLFGDGAGAAVISEVQEGQGFLAFDLGADGSGSNLLAIEGGGSRNPASMETINAGQHYVTMEGKEVFKFAVRILGKTSKKVIKDAGLEQDDIDYLVPHQANIRIVDAALKKFHVPKEKTMINLDKYGNMSGASIPVALDEALKENKIKEDDVVVLVGFGAGLTWASCVVKWPTKNKEE